MNDPHLHNLETGDNNWWGKHRIHVGDAMPKGNISESVSYSEALASSVFCFSLMGEGCIPVLIHDEVEPSWNFLLAVETYSVRIAHDDMERVPEILSEEEIARMQANVARVWRSTAATQHRPLVPFQLPVDTLRPAGNELNGASFALSDACLASMQAALANLSDEAAGAEAAATSADSWGNLALSALSAVTQTKPHDGDRRSVPSLARQLSLHAMRKPPKRHTKRSNPPGNPTGKSQSRSSPQKKAERAIFRQFG
ncbi:hypothetical protein ACK3TF_003045 [Chlorella vulgaris]